MDNSGKQQAGIFGLLPVLPQERVWGAFDFAMVNIGLAIATWCFLIGGTLSMFVGVKMGFAATLAGNTISVLLMALATTVPSCQYGVDQYVSLRSVFGQHGTKVALFSIILIEFGWVAVLAIMFGKAGSTVYGALVDQPNPSLATVIVFALIAIAVSWIVVAKGPVSIKWLNRIVAPGLVIMLLFMLFMLLQKHSFQELLALEPLSPDPNPWWNYMIAFELGLGSGLSWWPIMGGMARLVKTQRAAFWSNMVGINLCAVLGTMIGLISGLAVGTSDPVEWMIPIGGPIIGLLALLFVAFANITSITSLAYSVSLALKQIRGFVNTDWTRLTFFFMAPSVPFVFFPDEVYSHFSTFLAMCGTVIGPLVGIGLVDYFLLRKQQIHLAALFADTPGSPYYYWGGYNLAAIASLVGGTLLYFLILDPVTFDHSLFFLFFSASIPVIILTGILYYVLTRMFVIPRGFGGYGKKETAGNQTSVTQ